MFTLAMFSFEECWERSTELMRELPSTEMYHDCLVYALESIQRILVMGPSSVEHMWELWAADKVSEINAISAQASKISARAYPEPAAIRSSLSSSSVTPSVSPDDKAKATTLTSVSSPRSRSASTSSVGEVDPPVRVRRSSSADSKDRSDQSSSHGSTMNNNSSHASDSVTVGDAMFHEDALYGTTPILADIPKSLSGITSTVLGGSNILGPMHIRQLEAALPKEYQCMNWKQVFRMTRDGANITTLMRLSKKSKLMLLVVKDSHGCIFGALVRSHWR